MDANQTDERGNGVKAVVLTEDGRCVLVSKDGSIERPSGRDLEQIVEGLSCDEELPDEMNIDETGR